MGLRFSVRERYRQLRRMGWKRFPAALKAAQEWNYYQHRVIHWTEQELPLPFAESRAYRELMEWRNRR